MEEKEERDIEEYGKIPAQNVKLEDIPTNTPLQKSGDKKQKTAEEVPSALPVQKGKPISLSPEERANGYYEKLKNNNNNIESIDIKLKIKPKEFTDGTNEEIFIETAVRSMLEYGRIESIDIVEADVRYKSKKILTQKTIKKWYRLILE